MSPTGILEPATSLAGPHRLSMNPDVEQRAESRDFISLAALAVIAIGVIWRLLRYALAFPIWGDEAMFALNLVSRDFADVLEPLENGQVAPALFVLGEWACYQFLGPSEYAMRLLPLLAGLLSLPLFWMLARTLLPRRTALLAVAILSVSIWPVSMSALIKPYSADLFWSLTLLLPAAKILSEPNSVRWWSLLIIATPFALLGSFPALFVSAGVGFRLAVLIFQLRSLRATALLGLLGVATSSTFAFNYVYVITETPTVTQDYMEWYWRSGFPPSNPFEFLLWFVKAHVGQTFAYPIGAANGGSAATFLVALVGAVCLWRTGRFDTLFLCLAPFAFSFLGAVLKKYPYGDSCRLAQHLAPAVCLLAAVGLCRIFSNADGRFSSRAGIAVFLTLGVVGLAGIVRDCVRPYRGAGDVWSRQVIREVFRHIDPADRVLVHVQTESFSAAFHWYLLHQDTPVEFLKDSESHGLSKRDASKTWSLDLAFCLPGEAEPEFETNAIRRLIRTFKEQDPSTNHHFVQSYAHIEHVRQRKTIQFCAVHLWSRDSSVPLLAGAAP